ncbi:amino acid adenylation domain-containing protein [Algoriphagus namhaensis]|uniref:Amino acid adenylation domain-containing protein n=1 Tax=Algoriphagus namhaensis TaxID=915353 RepID=A0ABV8AW91_9BACT
MEDNSDDLLDQWLNFSGDNEGEEKEGSIPKAPLADSYPLSDTQQRLWLVYQKNPKSPVYNYAEIWTFDSNSFDEAQVKKAFRQLISSHTILASNYVLEGENPRMKIRSERDFEWVEGESFKSEKEAKDWLKAQASRPFRLESDPLVRLATCQVSGTKILLGLTFHHIIIDAWSIDLIRKGFAEFYAAQSSISNDSSSKALQFQDYSVWQNEQAKDRKEISRNAKVKDAFLDLPLDYSRPAIPSYKGQFLRFNLPETLTGKVNQLLQKTQSTSFSLFLTVFQILLSRYSKSQSIYVGIPVLNREQDELKDLAGYFVDTQVIGGELDPSQTFLQVLKQTQKEVLQTISSEKATYEQMLQESGQYDQSSNPLFQAMFVGHSSGGNPFEEAGISTISFDVLDLDVSKFDLTLHHFGVRNGQYEIGVEISTDLFNEAFAERLSGHFATLLDHISANPSLPISAYSLISEEERDFLTHGLNQGFDPDYTGSVIPEILKNLQEKGDEVALVCGDQKLSYAELDQRSKALANELDRLNVDRNQPIGIYLNRSVDFVVSIVGILRYGGYYLPLDPDYPEQRISQYIEESGAEFVISTSSLWPKENPISTEIQVIEINSNELSQSIDNHINKEYKIGEYAYLIFTSGSTNKPKGVRVSHQNLYSSNQARKAYYSAPMSAFLLVSSFSFDSSIAGIFWSLCTGGKLVISQNQEALDAFALGQIIQREEISHTLMLPSLHKAILENSQEELSALQAVLVAGEECPADLIGLHFEKLKNTQLFNEYGPSEGTVWCTAQELLPKVNYPKVPIGLATNNTLSYVLEPDQSLTPIGLPGELCIAGPGVVNGYLKSENSDQKFVKNPYSEEWETLYRTGDLVRIQKDGLLEYLGRIDNQVKIRGHRVELNEIQSLAQKFEDVKSAIAFVADSGARKLVLAYLVKDSKFVDSDKLRAFLTENLPKYMVPEQYLVLAQFPLLPNGKVDLRKLSIEAQNQSSQSSSLPKLPSTYLERQIAQVWSDVLGPEDLPVNKDFNELGGNSLQSIRILARLREIGIKVTPEQFLRYSTVESLVNSLNTEPYERPKNTLELEILGIWEQGLSQKLIGVLDSFQKNGGAAAEWKGVEEKLYARFDFAEEISLNDSIRTLATKVKVNEAKYLPKELKRIIPISTTGDELPLFCIHSEFYYETVYAQLTRHLPGDYPIYGVLSVSPELVKDYVPKSIEEIAQLCREEIKVIQPEGPIRILSYSIGNVVAFEIARQLKEAGEEVQLILIDPPLFFDKSRTFGKNEYRKYLTYLDLWNRPAELLEKVRKKVNKDGNQGILIQETGLLKKYILKYKIAKIDCEALLITTPREFKHTYDWDPLVNLVDREHIDGPHLKLMREPYSSQMNTAITRSLRRWDQKSKK